MLYGFNALVGAVRFGLEHATLCVAEAASSTASGGYEARGGERGCARVPGAALWRVLGMVQKLGARRIGGAPRSGSAWGGDKGWR